MYSSEATTTVCNCSSTTPEVSTTTTEVSPSPSTTEYFPGHLYISVAYLSMWYFLKTEK